MAAKPPAAVGGRGKSGTGARDPRCTAAGGADPNMGGRENGAGSGGGELLGRRTSGGGRDDGFFGCGRFTGSVTRTACPVGSSMRSEPLSSSASSSVPSSTGMNADSLSSSDEGIAGRGPASGLAGLTSRPRRGPARGGPARPLAPTSGPVWVDRVVGLGTCADVCDGPPDGSVLRSLPSLTGCGQDDTAQP